MPDKDDQNSLCFAEKAFTAFMEIMSGMHKNKLENFNRTHKGELFVLQFLAMHGPEVLPSELSAAMQASTARISALLGVLEKKGQITRDIDKSNRRNILVTITPSGRSRVQTEMREMKSCITRVFAEMGEADASEFIRLTRQFTELLKNHFSPEDGLQSK